MEYNGSGGMRGFHSFIAKFKWVMETESSVQTRPSKARSACYEVPTTKAADRLFDDPWQLVSYHRPHAIRPPATE